MRLRLKNVPIPEAHLGSVVLGAILQRAFPRRLFRAAWIGLLLGWPLILLGAGLSLWAAREAGEMDVSSPDALLTEGPYAASRNPMYVGWTLMQAGISFIKNTIWPLALLPPVIAYTHRFEIREEEEFLERKFGDEYLAYKHRVPRYF